MTRLLSTTALLAICMLTMPNAVADAQDWPQWRGPNRDNKAVGFVDPKEWPKQLTKKWSVKVGFGDASPVLVGDRLYVFTRQGSDEVTLCLDAGSGKELWKDKYQAKAVTGAAAKHPGPRSTPAVADGKICTFGVAGTLSCLDAKSGKELWRKPNEGYPPFFASSSPVIADGLCIALVGGKGKGQIAGFELASGERKWALDCDGVPYGSPIVATISGVKQVVTLTEKSLVGVSLADGKQLWKTSYAAQYNSGTPLVSGNTVYCSGPNAGTVAFAIDKDGDTFSAKQLWKKSDAATKFNTPVLKDGLIYGINKGRNFFCMKAANGEVLWTDKTEHGECGSIIDAGNVMVGLTSDSNLIVFRPSDKEFTELARIKVADSQTWACPILAGNRIYVKDNDSLTCWTVD